MGLKYSAPILIIQWLNFEERYGDKGNIQRAIFGTRINSTQTWIHF